MGGIFVEGPVRLELTTLLKRQGARTAERGPIAVFRTS